MASKDKRANAKSDKQTWIPLQMIDNIKLTAYLKHVSKNRHTVYGFSGQSEIGNIRIDFRKNSKANLIGDFFKLLDDIPDESVDVFIVDPLFELYNPNIRVWHKLTHKGRMPRSSEGTRFFAHPHLWQKEVFKKVKPGGIMISKRNIANTNVLTKFPQLFYVGDARPMAYIVRIDHK